jgi:1-deoxy-D-xylulose-5-phosphate synthase
MAIAADLAGETREHIAVIGDGAMSAGMAFEALNHAGALDLDLLVILNDNDMSISPPVGAVSNYLARAMSSRFYNRVREGGKQVLSGMPGMKDLVHRWEEHMKGMVTPGTLFEELGFNYIGPIDGHDLPLLLNTLRNMKHMRGPRFLHIVSQKGHGYAPAEGDPCVYHGVSPFDPSTGTMAKKRAAARASPASSRIGSVTRRRPTTGSYRGDPRDVRGLRTGRVRKGVSAAILRCRYRRTACRHGLGRYGLRGPEAGRRDLLDLPAARL